MLITRTKLMDMTSEDVKRACAGKSIAFMDALASKLCDVENAEAAFQVLIERENSAGNQFYNKMIKNYNERSID